MTHPRDRLRLCLTLALCATSTLVLTGCPKEEPEPDNTPTFVPPPPPPPPSRILLTELSSELSVDPRVQFSNASWGVEDRGFGQELLELADAFARGDSDALRGLLSTKAAADLDYLVYSGQWDQITQDIEAVRIVWFREGAAPDAGEVTFDLTGVEASLREALDLESLYTTTFSEELGLELPLSPASIADAFSEIITKYGSEIVLDDDVNPEDPVSILTDSVKMRSFLDALRKHIAEIRDGDPPMAIDPDPASAQRIADDLNMIFAKAAARWLSINRSSAVLMSVQQPDGAFLLGWSIEKALGTYVFSSVQTVENIKRRASQFDDVGFEGFFDGRAVAAVFEQAGGEFEGGGAPEGTPGAGAAPGSATAPAGGGSPPEADPDEPPIKRTPGGPVRLPPGSGRP